MKTPKNVEFYNSFISDQFTRVKSNPVPFFAGDLYGGKSMTTTLVERRFTHDLYQPSNQSL